MKRIFSSIAILAFLISATPSTYAQTKVGIGVGVQGGIGGVLSFVGDLEVAPNITTFYIPIVLNGFRAEPELGVWWYNEEDGGVTQNAMLLVAGTGLFFHRPISAETLTYFGLRGGIAQSSSSTESGGISNSDSRLDFFAAPTVGGEHYFFDFFSLGAEVRVNVVFLGNFEGESSTRTIISTQAAFFVRWYFN